MSTPERPYIPWQEALGQGSRVRAERIEGIRQVQIDLEEKFSSESFWRRHHYSLATVAAILGVPLGLSFLSACSQPPAIVREATPIPEPTRTPTLELPRLLETIKLPMLGLTVEKYAANFEDITSEINEFHKQKVLKKEATPLASVEQLPPWAWAAQCGSSVIYLDKFRPDPRVEYVFYNGNERRSYAVGIENVGPYGIPPDEDKKMLNWQVGADANIVADVNKGIDMSCNGKFLYQMTDKPWLTGLPPIGGNHAVIIADIPRATKTIIKDDRGRSFSFLAELTDNGNRLFLSFPGDKDPQRGTYLIDLDNWQIQFHINESSDKIFLNEDGTIFYLHPDSFTSRVGYIYNTVTGEKTVVQWPYDWVSYGYITSPNLQYIVSQPWIFPPEKIIVYTPNGMFMISSPQKSLSPLKIDNNGTIHADSGDVFEFKDGTYKLDKTGDGKPAEVRVTKLSSQ